MKKILIFFCFVTFANTVCIAQDTTRLSLLFLGDIMQHDSQISDAFDPVTKKYDYRNCFQYVKPYIQEADLAIGNLELTLAGPPYKGYPQFSAPDELLLGIKDMGVDVLVTANNHCVDTGKKGLERTIKMLDSLSIPHTGTFKDEADKSRNHPLMVRKNGVSLAILNYTYGTNGLPVTKPNIVNMIDTVVIGKDLLKAKALSPDAIIVFVHWGSEYQSLPSKWQKDVAEYCFVKGAQLVIGAHPHVLQPMELRKDKNQLVAYSLGNFVSGQRKRYTDGGGMITVDLTKVTFPDQSSLTTIDTANYILEWVYRTKDSEKNYYILPVPTFEQNFHTVIRDSASRADFKLFINDSRALFRKHNKSIGEWTAMPADSLIRYKVEISGDTLTNNVVDLMLKYGVEQSSIDTGAPVYLVGDFREEKDAHKYIERLQALGYHEGRVVRVVNGNVIRK